MSDISESTAVALVDQSQAVAVLTDAEKFDAFYTRIKAETDKLVPDLTTEKGRKEIAAMAFKVVKTKTFIDGERVRLTEDKRNEIKAVDEAGKKIRDRLDALRDEVRAPLTNWETAERERLDKIETMFTRLKNEAVVLADETAADILTRIEALRFIEIPTDVFQAQADVAEMAKASAIEALTSAWHREVKAEQDAAELARLRAENEARIAREAEEQAARDAERRRQEAAQYEQDQAALAAAAEKTRLEAQEAERVAEAARVADEARLTAERAAEVERERIAAAHQAELDAANERAAKAERDRLAEIAAREEAARVQRLVDDEAARIERERQEDREHRRSIMSEAKAALMTIITAGEGQTPEQVAVSIVRAIVAKEVPNLRIEF